MREKNKRMIKAGSAGEGTPFADAIYEVPIKNDDYYIVRNKYEDGGKIKVFLINNLINIKAIFIKIEKYFYEKINCINHKFELFYENHNLFWKKKIAYLVSKDDRNNSEFSNISNANANSYSLVKCNSGNCKKTNGYVKNGGDDIYAFVNDNVEKVTDIENDCVGDISKTKYNVGKITASGMCIGDQIEVEFPVSGTKNYVIISDRPAVASTPFKDLTVTGRNKKSNANSPIGIPIESGANYIIINQFYDGGNIFLTIIIGKKNLVSD